MTQKTILLLLVAAVSAGAQGTSPGLIGRVSTPKLSVPPIVPKPVMVDDGTLVPGGEVLEGEEVYQVLDKNTSSVFLDKIFNAHWRGVDRFAHAGKTFEVSVTFDLAGETYLTLLAPGAAVPRFYRLERSMDGRWNTAGTGYRADIAITNIFCRICNTIRIQADGGKRVYYKQIKELVKLAYFQGSQVRAGNRDFRVYFSNDLNRQPEGRIVDDRFGIVIVYGKADDPKRLIVPFSALSAGTARRYQIKDGPAVILRIDPGTRTLYLSAP